MNNNFIPARDKKEKKDIERKRKSEKNSKKNL